MADIKPIEGFTGYFIDTDGKVWCNLGRGSRMPVRTVPLYEVKGRPGKNGYLRVYMRNDITNKRVDKYIHRLVAMAFLPNPENKKCVNHKDCNRWNNSVSNLEWCTYSENTTQTIELGHTIRDKKTGRYVSNFDYRDHLKLEGSTVDD